MQTLYLHLFLREPVPIFQVELPDVPDALHLPFDYLSLLQKAADLIDVELWDCGFRGVAISKLSHVVETGIDVKPTTSIIFVDDFEKAWEYGGWPKLLLALDQSKLDQTFREVPADTPNEELILIGAQFPTKRVSQDGTRFWYSRLPETDMRITTEYESAYARWIPGDPSDVLRAVFVFGLNENELATAIGHTP